MRKNIVLDTNTVLSATLFPLSIVGKAYDKALDNFQPVISSKTYAELDNVFRRSKFDKYLEEADRLLSLESYRQDTIFIEPSATITDCRDPKDNKFLELAVACDAQFIVTGDDDLLVLNPYRGITILKSGDFLALELV
jgi:uncharacterized protein